MSEDMLDAPMPVADDHEKRFAEELLETRRLMDEFVSVGNSDHAVHEADREDQSRAFERGRRRLIDDVESPDGQGDRDRDPQRDDAAKPRIGGKVAFRFGCGIPKRQTARDIEQRYGNERNDDRDPCPDAAERDAEAT